MNRSVVRPSEPLCGRVRIPGDKSISHRALILCALANGPSQISGFLPSGDCLATLACIRALGVTVTSHDATSLTIHGRGLDGLCQPTGPLDCVRSGTTMRLLAGVLAGQSFTSRLTGHEQLLRRPMRRIVDPLCRMGAKIESTDSRAPLTIHGRQLQGYDHTLAIPSAQVKSALLLGGLYADGPTTVHQPGPARDHTERMMSAMGACIETQDLTVTLEPSSGLSSLSLDIPGDISSAGFLMVAAALVPESRVTLESVGVNPTRTGLLDVLGSMGAKIAVENEHEVGNEPVADITVCASELSGTEIGGELVVRMIDEFPVLAVAATQALGTTTVRDATELRVKETDRIATIISELRVLGACVEPLPDGFIVRGPTPLHGGVVDSHGDHRLAMALSIAGLIAQGETIVGNADCASDSFPEFDSTLDSLRECHIAG